MRGLEILALASLALGLIAILAGRAVLARSIGLFALAAVALLLVRDGGRWQMLPAYAAAGLLLLALLVGVLPTSATARLTSAALAVLATLSVVAAAALSLLLPVVSFPEPGGPFAIGTIDAVWTDTARSGLFAGETGRRRQVLAQIFYPAEASASPPSAYIPEGPLVTHALARLVGMPEFLFDHLALARTHAVPNAPLAASAGDMPVLIYLTGLGGYRGISTFEVQELVSRGYVVVALDQPGGSAAVRLPDGAVIEAWPKIRIQPLIDQSSRPVLPAPRLRETEMPEGIIPYFAADVSLAIDNLAGIEPLAGRLDLDRIGVFGISLGGIVAAEACHADPRLRACVIMDAQMPASAVADGFAQPAMWLTRTADVMRLERQRSGGWSEADIELHQTSMRAAFERSSGPAYFAEIDGIFHVNFTDVAIWSPLLQAIGMVGPIAPARAHDIVNAYTLAFFDRSLRQQESELLSGPSALYPEVRLEGRAASAL